MNYVIFGINSAFLLVFLHAGILCIILGFVDGGRALTSPFAFLGGFVIVPICSLVLLYEWRATIRKHQESLHGLGVLALVFAGFVLFGYVSNIAEAISEGAELDGEFWFWFSLIAGLLSIYSLLTGIYRVRLSNRWKTEPELAAAEIDDPLSVPLHEQEGP